MNIMNKVTLQAMKKNRVRTIVTIIGIILSAAMFTAVTTFCSSMYGYMREYFAYDKGDYHVSFSGCSSETIDKIKADERVSKAAVAKPIGYAEAGSSNADKPYLYVLEADESFMKNMPVHLTNGRLPENENEIILPAHLQANGGVSHKIGDRLKLTLGRRVAEDGSELGQNNPYSYDEEKLTADRIWEYVVVGFYERPGFEEMIAPGYTALSLLSEPLREGETYDAYILMKNPRKNLDAFAERLSGSFTEASYQASLLTMDGYSVFNNYSNACEACRNFLRADFHRLGFADLQCIFNFCKRKNKAVRLACFDRCNPEPDKAVRSFRSICAVRMRHTYRPFCGHRRYGTDAVALRRFVQIRTRRTVRHELFRFVAGRCRCCGGRGVDSFRFRMDTVAACNENFTH